MKVHLADVMLPDLPCKLIDVSDQLADVSQTQIFEIFMQKCCQSFWISREEALIDQFFSNLQRFLRSIELLNIVSDHVELVLFNY